MGIVKFDVIFDKPDKICYPGEMMTGRVELKLDAVKQIRGIELQLIGKANCKWSDTETYYDRENKRRIRTVYRSASETYLKLAHNLIGRKRKFELPAGEHIYPFGVMLPIKIPSSYEGSYGGVFYYIEAKIDSPMAFDEIKKFPFRVINPLNLNLYPNLKRPYKNENSKTFGCLCCTSGPLTIVAIIPKTGFAPFECIPFTIEVDNASDVEVDAVNVYLKREIRWKANGHLRCEKSNLQKLSLRGVEEGQSHTWRENFIMPRTPFPFLDGCLIINIDHKLCIEAVASGMHSNLDINIPIMIGDIPLSEDPNAPIVPPQVQTYSNMDPNPGMQPLGHPQSNYSSGGYPTPVNPIPKQQYSSQAPHVFPSIPPQSSTNPQYSENAPYPPN